MEKVIRLKDSSEIKVGLAGRSRGKTIILPVAKESVYGQEAESLKLWGSTPNPDSISSRDWLICSKSCTLTMKAIA